MKRWAIKAFVSQIGDNENLLRALNGASISVAVSPEPSLDNPKEAIKLFVPYDFAKHLSLGQAVKVIIEPRQPDEDATQTWREEVVILSKKLTEIIASYETGGFMDLARKHKALEDLPDRFVFSVNQLQKAIAGLSRAKRVNIEQAYGSLRELASKGELARFGKGNNFIELAKPVMQPTSKNKQSQ